MASTPIESEHGTDELSLIIDDVEGYELRNLTGNMNAEKPYDDILLHSHILSRIRCSLLLNVCNDGEA